MSNRPTLTFLYGFPAAGKTTFAQHFIAEHPEYDLVGADLVRQELYGSQDHYGNSSDIYQQLLKHMVNSIVHGRSVLYDGTNLKKQDRTDFLEYLRVVFPPKRTEIIQLPTTMDVCIARHLERGREIPLSKLLPYFSIHESPTKDEGWDAIYTCCTRAYIASPFFEDEHRANAIAAAEILRGKGIDVYLPLEHKVPNAWDLPNHEWGAAVYRADVNAIHNSDTVIVLSYGRLGSAGTAWEAGYAFGIGKRVLMVEMPGVELMSLMMANGRTATIRGLEGLTNYDFIRFPALEDRETEQK